MLGPSVPPRRDEHQTGAPGPQGAVDLAGPAALARRPGLRAPLRSDPRDQCVRTQCAPLIDYFLSLQKGVGWFRHSSQLYVLSCQFNLTTLGYLFYNRGRLYCQCLRARLSLSLQLS